MTNRLNNICDNLFTYLGVRCHFETFTHAACKTAYNNICDPLPEKAGHPFSPHSLFPEHKNIMYKSGCTMQWQ
jgi:hypothetical protein